MRALMNFMHRDGWSFQILAEDCKTILVGHRSVGKKETLLSMIARRAKVLKWPGRTYVDGTAAASGSIPQRCSAAP